MIPEIFVDQPTDAAAAQPDAPSGSLGRDDFLRMLIAQLENQDPLNPQDATEFSSQLAQFSSLEQLVSMSQNLESVVESQTALSNTIQSLASNSLIGREVIAQGARFEMDGEGGLVSTPAFQLGEGATHVKLRVTGANGAPVEPIDLGPRAAGFHTVPASVLEGLPGGVYDFSVEATVDGETRFPGTFLRGSVTGSVPSGADPLVTIGGLFVPYSDLTEVRGNATP